LANIDRHDAAVLSAVMDAHAFATQPAQHPSLQQRRPLTHGSGTPLDAVGAAVVEEPLLVCLEAFPVDIAAVGAGYYELPFGSRQYLHTGTAVRAASRALPTIDEGAGVAGVVQHLQHARVLRKSPEKFALVRS
jgi:hypothetical protein